MGALALHTGDAGDGDQGGHGAERSGAGDHADRTLHAFHFQTGLAEVGDHGGELVPMVIGDRDENADLAHVPPNR